jgi:hypothetical protein
MLSFAVLVFFCIKPSAADPLTVSEPSNPYTVTAPIILAQSPYAAEKEECMRQCLRYLKITPYDAENIAKDYACKTTYCSTGEYNNVFQNNPRFKTTIDEAQPMPTEPKDDD